MNNINGYYKLKKLQRKYPQLTFDNIGYQYLSPEIKESHREQIKEIENILKQLIKGFVEFNNFKPRKDGTFAIRCQYCWDERFTGVGYFNINLLKL